ncbi:MAG TPA: DNA topoisomerase IV, partial [Cyanothece sp. UBA12306]|nr:DNA topoisomerase IV [Cyanothece sp. UBA12306]
MTRQLNLLATGQIIPTALHTEMKRSYLEYAMSVIVGRALPDVRDGLKPVHRRIIYAMYELGLTPDRPFRKCARVVGDVLGKYHPHGDQAVYDALVRLVQDFSSRYPLLAGHGNFGSVDNDPPAAMRYTETRLAPIADTGMLSQISEAIVDFTNNFDNSQQEPVVLPAQLPILLLNGCTGIAVGMATNIPPHNLGEIVDGLVALIDNPELSDEKLWKLIPGPDFPTGGEFVNNTGIQEAYATGKGIIPVRGITRIETLNVGRKRRKERTAIVVTELPYQVNKSAWIEKMADLVNQGRLEGIADIRDESDRTGMRVVIELKRETKPNVVLKSLYKQTALQSNFGAILLALVDNKPCQLSLRQLLEEFLRFREQTLTRQYGHELEEAQNRLHLLQGLLIALNNLDAVIDILRHAADGTTAKMRFKEELDISDDQANAILAMPMRRLTGLERQKLQAEHDELQTRIAELENLLNDRQELLKTLKKELRSLKRKFGDPRRTRLVKSTNIAKSQSKTKSQQKDDSLKSPASDRKSQVKSEDSSTKSSRALTLFTPQKPPEDAILEISNLGEAAWRNPGDQGQNSPIFRAIIGQKTELMVITDTAKAYPVKVEEIPPLTIQSIPLLQLLPKSAQRDAKRVIDTGFLPNELQGHDLLLLTQQGRIKRIEMSQLGNLTNRGLVLMKLKDGDRLNFVCGTQEGQEVAIATSGGRILRFPVTDEVIPLMGRNAQGNQAVKLRYGESLVNCVPVNAQNDLILISGLGYGKRLSLNELRLSKLGDLGTQCLQFANKQDKLVGMIPAQNEGNLNLITNQNRSLTIAITSILPWGKEVDSFLY